MMSDSLQLSDPYPGFPAPANFPITGPNAIGNINTKATVVPGYSLDQTNVAVVEQLVVSWGGNTITEIVITLSNGVVVNGGSQKSAKSSAQLSLAVGETITTAILAGNGTGGSLGYLYLETSQGQTFTAGSSDADKWIMPVGSGLLLGLWMRAGEYIDFMALIFTSASFQLNISNVVYVDPPTIGSDSSVATMSLSVGSFGTESSEDCFEFTGSQQMTETHSWTRSQATEYSASVTVSASIFVLDVDATAGWSITNTTETETELTISRTFEWSLSGKVGSATRTFTALGRQASLQLPYTAILQITPSGGDAYTGVVNGTYQNVVFGSVVVSETSIKLFWLTPQGGVRFEGIIPFGNSVYVTAFQGTYGVWTFDLASRTLKQITSTSQYGFRAIAAVGGTAYLTTQGNDGGIWELDLTTQMVNAIEATAGLGFNGVIAFSDSLFLAGQAGGVGTFSPSSGTVPVQLATTYGYNFNGIVAVAQKLYLTQQGSLGVWVLDVGADPSLKQIASTNGFGFDGIAAVGDVLYLTSQAADGVWVLDTRSGARPTQLAETAGLRFNGITVVNNVLYLTTEGNDGIWSYGPLKR